MKIKKILIICVSLLICLLLVDCLQWSHRLTQAIYKDDQDAVNELLLEDGHDINKKSGYVLNICFGDELSAANPLEAAIYSDNYQYIVPLLEYGADPNSIEVNPVSWIMEDMNQSNYEEKSELIDIFFEYGLDPDYVAGDGESMLCVIAGEDVCNEETGEYDHEYAEYILNLYKSIQDKCDDKKQVDEYGNTPIHWAVAYGKNIDLIEYLIVGCGYSIDELNDDEQTPLIFMFSSQSFEYPESRCNVEEVIEFCVNNNCDLSLKDKNGYTACDYAQMSEYLDIDNLLDF